MDILKVLNLLLSFLSYLFGGVNMNLKQQTKHCNRLHNKMHIRACGPKNDI
jgi:hypothetical protein